MAAQRRADRKGERQVLRPLGQKRQGLLHPIQQGVLVQQIVEGITADRQFGKHHQLRALIGGGGGLFQNAARIGDRIAQMHGGSHHPDADKAVGEGRVKGRTTGHDLRHITSDRCQASCALAAATTASGVRPKWG